MYEHPRLSRSLRAYTDLELAGDFRASGNNVQQQLWREKQLKRGVLWSDLKEYLHSQPMVLDLLQKLRVMARALAGSDQSSDVIDDASMFLLRLFLNQHIVLLKHLSQLKQMFGQVTTQIANQICELVTAISSLISEECKDYLSTDDQNIDNKSLWGSHIKCSLPNSYHTDVSALTQLAVATGSSSKVADHFSMKYKTITSSTTNGASCKTEYGKAWLEKELDKSHCSDNVSNAEFCQSVISMLQSNRGNEELQNDLFDLLGFDRFELIQLLLEKRQKIINSLLNEIANSVNEKKSNLNQLLNGLEKIVERRPALGCQVIVQSEEERLLLKQARKEEKKIREDRKSRKNIDDDSNSDNEFNASDLRAKRQALLLKGKACLAGPVLTKRSAKAQISYPHVYDAQSNARAQAGIVSGGRMLLPDGVERIDNKMYEEVIIPANPPAPMEVGSQLIEISSLDQISQMAFQGIKTLNRIQSVVFPAAYQTNENLLICAPTGAGKTNVAMLTMLHQIKKNLEQGVIQKDQFKIVYVAPMKALASEMAAGFSRRLAALGMTVRELTGDMQLTKSEIMATQVIVTTPEKWDVVTRKSTGDVALASLVKLLIIDEVHLLHGDRGPVIEALVARTLRLVESSQTMIRIVGLSATLPNYIDVARFLRVNPYIGLFYFDARFRPVPLSQTFIGVKALKPLVQMVDMNTVCFEKALDMVQKGHQVMVFVHARNETGRLALVLKEMAQQKGVLKTFEPEPSVIFSQAVRVMQKSRNKQMAELFPYGFGTHHAGMIRSDRNLVEKYFANGLMKVLVCTSTLAWGVNLPAHAVIIKGTEIYDSKHGTFIDLGILDVLQIFGRAGRPQFDQSGTGTIITSHNKLPHYLSLLTNQFPIESNFVACLADNLNAEIVLGTISNVEEAIEWLSYTYLFVRMRINPQVYGMNYQDVMEDPTLERKRREIITTAAKALDKAAMIRYNERTGDLSSTDLGRTASHFYIKYDTVEIFNEKMKPIMTEGDLLSMVSHAQEFQQLKVRDDEMQELDDLTQDHCEMPVPGGSENLYGKVNILMQTYLSRGSVKSNSLQSDLSYVTQNAVRITRALFEIELRRNNPLMAGRLLTLSKMLELRLWDFQNPLRQFVCIPHEILNKLDDSRLRIEDMRDMDPKEIGSMLRHLKMGSLVKKCAEEFPLLDMSATLQPITRTVLRINLHITPNFRWNDKVHGRNAEAFYIWVEDPESNLMYHSEYFLITKKQVIHNETQELVMTIPLVEPLPPQYYVRATSDRWLGSLNYLTLSFQHLILPEIHPPHTDLLELQPLPITALNDKKFESLYTFTHFNPIQTQLFHCLYHTDNNVLLGAPTGSGKTIVAEIAMCRVFKEYPNSKVVYIAPMKALVRERIEDWKIRLDKNLGKKVVELTGDVTPDAKAISEAHVIVTTPEKWDGISRSWQTRSYVRSVALIVIDEIHLLGEDRGPVLEVIVSRTNFIASHTEKVLRIVGLSTALANARDLANWLGIGQMGLYNFRPSVRPVPLEVHIAGFPGKKYCPRMATMNRPTFQAIRQHSPSQPALIFVSSRRQTRLTALDLIAYLAAEDDPKQWLHLEEQALDQVLSGVRDSSLKLTLAFGIGIHHAGLHERDRNIVEELFVNQKIQVLLATATLAWGVNFPAHLVVVKGTEYYDSKQLRYVDMPITDVLQMMGRAGRPQYDNHGIAVVLVHDVKKNFYKKFLYEPFPVESSLLAVLPDHINAEIVAETVNSKQNVLDYLTWTYFFRRLLQNPAYYQLESLEPCHVNFYLSNLVQSTIDKLTNASCIEVGDDQRTVAATAMGRIASYYYLSYKTVELFNQTITAELTTDQLLKILSMAFEYSTVPVRHNEDIENGELAKSCPLPVDPLQLDSPHVKTYLLLQAHLSRAVLPNSDYFTDTKQVLEQAIRIVQAMTDICSERGYLAPALGCQQVLQMLVQARWLKDSPLTTLPHVEASQIGLFRRIEGPHCLTLPGLKHIVCQRNGYEKLARPLRNVYDETQIEQIYKVLSAMPKLDIILRVDGPFQCNQEQRKVNQPLSRNDWIPVEPEQEYFLNIELHREGHRSSVHCPNFPRSKDEAWSLILGCRDKKELYAIKRVFSKSKNSKHQLTFTTPSRLGRLILTLYIMSDAYIGLDQQYDVQLEVVSADFTTAYLDQDYL